MFVEWAPVRDWLKARNQTNNLHLELMALCYDLDGAVDAGQLGLAWRSQEDLLLTGVQLYLRQAGVDFAPLPGEDRIDRALRAMTSLERIRPRLGAEAWRLWLRRVPAKETLEPEIERTLTFVRDQLGLHRATSRPDAVRGWADDTRALRAVARAFGVARSDDWYLVSDGAGTQGADWYGDLLRHVADEGRTA